MPDEPYNGWRNKATFDVAYMMETDEELSRRATSLATQHASVEGLAGALDTLCEELVFKRCSHDGSGLSLLRRYLVGDALDAVDWHAIAEQRLAINRGLRPD